MVQGKEIENKICVNDAKIIIKDNRPSLLFGDMNGWLSFAKRKTTEIEDRLNKQKYLDL